MDRLEVSFKSDAGKVRTANEDSVLVRRFGELFLLAVADGLGGHAAGEVASKMALIELEEFIKAHLSEPPQELLKGAVQKANREIYLLAAENPEYHDMGSTMVAALVTADKALVGNVGDSRAYLVDQDIKQITRDHSMVQDMVEKEEITSEQAWSHPDKNIVTRVLGTGNEVQADFFATPFNGGTLLLCSDGLTDALQDQEIKKVIESSPDLETACTRLVEAANEKGGRDNISVILAKTSI